MTMTAFCDRCDEVARYTCLCDRCEREPEDKERFHTCLRHRPDVSVAHRRVRQREPRWMDLSRPA